MTKNKPPYEELDSTREFLSAMSQLNKAVYVNRFALGRIRKDLEDGNPHPKRLAHNRQLAGKAQQDCEDIMIEHIKDVYGTTLD